MPEFMPPSRPQATLEVVATIVQKLRNSIDASTLNLIMPSEIDGKA